MAVNAEVILTREGEAEVVSIIANESADILELAPGKCAYTVTKSSDVIVAVDCRNERIS